MMETTTASTEIENEIIKFSSAKPHAITQSKSHSQTNLARLQYSCLQTKKKKQPLFHHVHARQEIRACDHGVPYIPGKMYV
jgi:hypothetical protein